MTKNIGESVRQRLLNLSREQKIDFQYNLIRYGIERVLYRISISKYRDRFYLKGAMLFALWTDQPLRPTKDVDFLAHGDSSAKSIKRIFEDILAIVAPEDGIVLHAESLQVENVREGQQYGGLSVNFKAELAGAIIPVRIDLGFGDVVTPGPLEVEFPAVLDFANPILMAYPKETVIAEKFEAMVNLGMANSRMKDFFDLKYLSDNFSFEGSSLAQAIKATFDKRRTLIPVELPPASTEDFSGNPGKQNQWSTFLKKNSLTAEVQDIEVVCNSLGAFLMPPSKVASSGKNFRLKWTPGKGWKEDFRFG